MLFGRLNWAHSRVKTTLLASKTYHYYYHYYYYSPDRAQKKSKSFLFFFSILPDPEMVLKTRSVLRQNNRLGSKITILGFLVTVWTYGGTLCELDFDTLGAHFGPHLETSSPK